ncbi:hypothetical protein Cadr_000002416 [Camelus dromedarius]|uniref:Uncharacterized protein n=1 Tax=Camelus dromedarius TaxID=9838 RepID=A0A5N4EF59_CAMDR|nr:hypothetical protein Cadr_000002416 [Camelus dromedarius]
MSEMQVTTVTGQETCASASRGWSTGVPTPELEPKEGLGLIQLLPELLLVALPPGKLLQVWPIGHNLIWNLKGQEVLWKWMMLRGGDLPMTLDQPLFLDLPLTPDLLSHT